MHKAITELNSWAQSPALWCLSEKERAAQPAMLCLDAIQVSKEPPCFHSSHVYLKTLKIPTNSSHSNNLPFFVAARVKHLAVNC